VISIEALSGSVILAACCELIAGHDLGPCVRGRDTRFRRIVVPSIKDVNELFFLD